MGVRGQRVAQRLLCLCFADIMTARCGSTRGLSVASPPFLLAHAIGRVASSVVSLHRGVSASLLRRTPPSSIARTAIRHRQASTPVLGRSACHANMQAGFSCNVPGAVRKKTIVNPARWCGFAFACAVASGQCSRQPWFLMD